LRSSNNPFGVVLEVARRALDKSSKDDEQLLVGKLDMLRHLLWRGLSKTKIRRLYDFINHYTTFENLENKLKFESEAQKITKSRKAMGLEEAILREVKEQGIEQGIEQNKRTVVIRSHQKGMPITDIAEITELTVEEVEQIIAAYEAKKITL